MRSIQVFILVSSLCIVTNVHAQNSKQQLASASIVDTTIKGTTKKITRDSTPVIKDTIKKKKHDPAKATRRSAIIPGWGQAYNHEYWKIPLVYGALAIP